MRKKPNSKLIGLFIVCGITLFLATVGMFVSEKIMADTKSEVVMYFSESIKGLDVGSPVVFKGVNIGRVSKIDLITDMDDSEFSIPVFVAFNRLQPFAAQRNPSADFAAAGRQRAAGPAEHPKLSDRAADGRTGDDAGRHAGSLPQQRRQHSRNPDGIVAAGRAFPRFSGDSAEADGDPNEQVSRFLKRAGGAQIKYGAGRFCANSRADQRHFPTLCAVLTGQ